MDFQEEYTTDVSSAFARLANYFFHIGLPSDCNLAEKLIAKESAPPTDVERVELLPTSEVDPQFVNTALPPKPTHPVYYKYQAELICRYPIQDRPEDKLPQFLPLFCFPDDLSLIHRESPHIPEETYHSFIITEVNGSKTYGVCVTFYERLPQSLAGQLEDMIDKWRTKNLSQSELDYAQHIQSQLAHYREILVRAKYQNSEGEDTSEESTDIVEDAKEKINLFEHLLEPLHHSLISDVESIFVPHSIGILSRWPCYDLSKDWLCKILQISRGDDDDQASSIPLERYLTHFIDEMPLIPPGKLELCITIGSTELFISRPPVNTISIMKNFSMYPLFRCLSPSNILLLFELALTENKILFVSSHLSMLTCAIESLCILMYPLSWHHIMIPILPARLMNYLQAPMPFMIGIHRDYFAKASEYLMDVNIIDLDNNTINFPTHPEGIPWRERKKLLLRLKRYSGADHQAKLPKRNIDTVYVNRGVPATCTTAFPGGNFIPFSGESETRQITAINDLPSPVLSPIIPQLSFYGTYNSGITSPEDNENLPMPLQLSEASPNTLRFSTISNASQPSAPRLLSNDLDLKYPLDVLDTLQGNSKEEMNDPSTESNMEITVSQSPARLPPPPLPPRKTFPTQVFALKRRDSLSSQVSDTSTTLTSATTHAILRKPVLHRAALSWGGNGDTSSSFLDGGSDHGGSDVKRRSFNFFSLNRNATPSPVIQTSNIGDIHFSNNNLAHSVEELRPSWCKEFHVFRESKFDLSVSPQSNREFTNYASVLDSQSLDALYKNPAERASVLSNRLSVKEGGLITPSSAPFRHGNELASPKSSNQQSISSPGTSPTFVSNFESAGQYGTCRVCLKSLETKVLKCDACKIQIHFECMDLVDSHPCTFVFEENKIRASFFKIFTSLFKNYKKFITRKVSRDELKDIHEADIDGSQPESWFRTSEFLAEFDAETLPFMRVLVETQAFSQFTYERAKKSDTDYDILFFDESIKEKLNRSKFKFAKEQTPFLSDKSYMVQSCVKALEVNTEGLESGRFFSNRSNFPTSLNEEYILPPRSVFPLLTDGDRAIMLAHTSNILQRSKITPNYKRQQDISKWMQLKWKSFHKPATEELGKVSEEERTALLADCMNSVTEVVDRFESMHLSNQTPEQLQSAIDELHAQNLIIVQAADEDQVFETHDAADVQLVLSRLSRVTSIYTDYHTKLVNAKKQMSEMKSELFTATAPEVMKPKEYPSFKEKWAASMINISSKNSFITMEDGKQRQIEEYGQIPSSSSIGQSIEKQEDQEQTERSTEAQGSGYSRLFTNSSIYMQSSDE